MTDEKVTLNGKEVSKKELDEKKKEVEKKSGMKLVEVKPNEFKTKLED